MQQNSGQKTQNQLFAFNRVKNLTFLPSKERAVLSFYAENYNWAEDKGCHWSQEKICELLGIGSEKTLRSYNKTLEELQWISIEKKFASTTSNHQSCFVHIHIGVDDPKTLDMHRQNLLSQIDKDSDLSVEQKAETCKFISKHGRHEIELQELLSAKENFMIHHPSIYSREKFLDARAKDSEKSREITY